MLFAEVRDTGRGISPEDAQRLFHYFEQAAAQDVAQVGTGLGLAISREFVHLLGGDISAESTPGEGSTFSFSIVVEETTADALVDGGEERRVLSIAPGQPEYRVLVVDDAPESRELLTSLLDPVGFCVRLAANGEEAVAAFAEWQPHAILMDMRMPVMSGYEATRRIRAAEGDAHVAIIAVTASAFSEMRQAVYDAGVDELITKPIHGSELLGAIGRILGLRYDYEEPTPAERREQSALDRSALAQLPSDILARLTQATLAADFDAVLAVAEDAARFDEGAAAALRILAERFDAESILDALPTRTG
jgi:CheY-like chemotaxis protein